MVNVLSLIQNIFGSYTPVSYFVDSLYWDEVNQTFETVTNEIVADGLAGVDWPWLAGVFLFAIAFYSVFRLIGVVLGGK